MNRTLSTVLDFLFIPAAATAAVVGVSSLMPSAADAKPHYFVNEDGSATRCETRRNTTKCRDLTPEQYRSGVQAEADYWGRFLRCGGMQALGTWAQDKCMGEVMPGMHQMSFKTNQQFCNDFGDAKYCDYVRDYLADQ